MRRERLGASLLLEVMVGLGIFTAAVLVVLALIPGGHRALNKGKEYILANAVARQTMDEQRSRAYTPAGPAQTTVLARGMRVDGAPIDTEYTITVDEQTLTTTPYESKSVLVTVQWMEKSDIRSVRLETIVVN